MATYSVAFYLVNPAAIFSTGIGSTFVWTGPATTGGTATINDPEAGIQGTTLDDDNAGGESATASVTTPAGTSAFTTVDAEIVWTVTDTVTGRTFEVAQFDVENGAASGLYTLSEVPLIAGRTYTVNAYNTNPNVAAGDIAFNSADYVVANNVVDGTAGNDSIGGNYFDAQNEYIDDSASAPNDSINAGAGNDTAIGGIGNDTLNGGDGDDLLYGDYGIYTPAPINETLDWTNQGGNGTNLAGGFTQDTGTVNVSVAFTNTGNNAPTYQVSTSDAQYVAPGETYDPNSSLFLFGNGDGATSTTTMTFATSPGASVRPEVQNVNFRINDVDWGTGNHTDIVTVLAYDINGNPVAVTLTPSGGDTVSGNTITANTVADNPNQAGGSVQVNIAGPVARIEISYANGQGGTQGIWITDVNYQAIPVAAGNDSLLGGTGNDTLFGEVGNDTLRGEVGNDSLIGGAGDDVVDGGDGNDTLVGGAGNDTFTGGTGVDTLTYAASTGGVQVNLATLSLAGGDAQGDVLTGGVENVIATAQADTLTGDAQANTFNAGAGNDTVSGGDGNDTLFGEAGNDSLLGGNGNDSLVGGDGDDTLEGGAGADTLSAGGGMDYISYATSDAGVTVNLTTNTFSGGHATGDVSEGGIDGIIGSAFNDSLTGYDGMGPGWTNVIYGGAGNDTIDGMGGDDSLYGEVGNDSILGGDGNDFIDGGLGNDTLDGGAGTDTIFGGDGADSILAGDGSDSVDGGTGNDTVDGGAGNDTITGGTGNDSLFGGDGVDLIYGGDGDDTIDGGDRTDTIYGGAGNDLIIDTGGNLSDDTIYGEAGNDTIAGGVREDYMDGGDDADTFIITDSFGNDTIVGGEGGVDFDTVDLSALSSGVTATYNANEAGTITDGIDTITMSAIERLVLTEQADVVDATVTTSGVEVLGGGGNDTITGGSGADTLFGGAGADSLSGGDGNDSILGGTGNDTLLGGFGNDTLDGGDNDDSLSGGEGADSLIGGLGNDTLRGGIGNDTLLGGGGNDVLFGDAGADLLSGGAGNDTIAVGKGDTIDGGDGDDVFNLVDLAEAGTAGITILGGTSGQTGGDTLNLNGLADRTTLVTTDTGGGEFGGSVTLLDGTVVTFSNIDNVICFTPGTRILTAQGPRAVEALRVGDMIVTRDHGVQPLRWVGSKTVPAVGHLAPVRISASVLPGAERALLVSPQHRVLFEGFEAELLFGTSEVLVSAKHMIDGQAVRQIEGGDVTYIHLMLDRHEVIYAEGAATESFHSGLQGIETLSDRSRADLFRAFPTLRADPNAYGDTARLCLKRHEAASLFAGLRPALAA